MCWKLKYIQTSYTVYIYIIYIYEYIYILCIYICIYIYIMYIYICIYIYYYVLGSDFPQLSRKLHGPHHSGCGGQWLCASALPERPGERGGWQRNHGVDVPVLPCNLPKTWESWEGPKGLIGNHGVFHGDFISHDGSMVLLYMVINMDPINIPIYPLYVSINIPAPWILWGFNHLK